MKLERNKWFVYCLRALLQRKVLRFYIKHKLLKKGLHYKEKKSYFNLKFHKKLIKKAYKIYCTLNSDETRQCDLFIKYSIKYKPLLNDIIFNFIYH